MKTSNYHVWKKLASDLSFSSGDQVIARDLLEDESIPEGFQLVPIRQLLQVWNTQQFEQASRAIQLLEWRRNHKFCSHCGHKTEVHALNMHGLPCLWLSPISARKSMCHYRDYSW